MSNKTPDNQKGYIQIPNPFALKFVLFFGVIGWVFIELILWLVSFLISFFEISIKFVGM